MQIEELREAGSDGGGFMGWFARGHYSTLLFAQEIFDEYGVDSDDRRWFRPEEVQHEWWRCIPICGDEGYSTYFQTEGGVQGAFEVTVMDIEKRNLARLGLTRRRYEEQGFRKGANFALEQMRVRRLIAKRDIERIIEAVREELG